MTENPTAIEVASDRYMAAARKAGCPRDQIENFLRAGIVLQERQLAASAAARLCDRRCSRCEALSEANCDPVSDCPNCGPTEIGYGGARGGGKSHWGLAQIFADDCARVADLKFLYLRKVGKSGKEAVQDLRREVLHSIPHDFTNNVLVRRDNGSRVILGHFQHEKDIDNYLGLQYDGVLIEEATQLSSRKVRDIGTCVRTTKQGWRPRKYYTTNPGNIGHAWFKARFLNPLRKGAETFTRFVQATVRDNAFVNPEYRAELERLTGWQRRAWLYGDWDIAAGQFFTNWLHRHHVIRLDELPGHWRVWLGFDYGYTHYTTCYLMAQDDDGNIFAVDEHARRKWLPQKHAEAIKSMCGRWGVQPYRLETIVAGHDLWNKDRNGKTIAEDYEALGLTMERANVDRIAGAAEILNRLGDVESDNPIPPRLFINERCAGLIECLPALEHDPHRPEDVLKVDADDDGVGGDDYYDAARYGVMYASNQPASFGPDPLANRW